MLVPLAALGGVAAFSFVTNAASAEVGLSMPFACRSDGGLVKLTPAPVRTYRIFGVERRQFSACSPRNADICRNWSLHRFDIDCGGVRVPWLSVVGALATDWMPNRFWVSEGRLHVRMGPRWSGIYVRPCSMRPPLAYGPWHSRGAAVDAPCARGLVDGPLETINLPPGFAPMLARFARFETLAQTRQAAVQSQGGATQTLETSSTPIAKRSSVVSTKSDAKSKTSSEAKVVDDKESVSRSKFPTAEDKEEASTPEEEITAIHEPSRTSQRLDEPLATPSKLWFGLIATFLILAIWLLRRGEESPDSKMVAKKETATRASRGSRPFATGTSAMSIHFDLLPKTRNEALQVLGASPETREEVLKELVRTLRRKWHPDQAREEERPFRERRLKQINVAWDILRNRQATSAFG